jgi:hypothetical protein
MKQATAIGVVLVGIDAREVIVTADAEPCSAGQAHHPAAQS